MIKKLEVGLGALEVDNTSYAPGWYRDAAGNRYYYDGNQWYVSAAGYLYPIQALGYMTTAPKQVTLAPGDKLKITIGWQYSGPAVSGVIARYCIGVYGTLGFDEKLYGENTLNLPACTSSTSFSDSYTFTIPSNVVTDWNDIYAKLYGGSPNQGNPWVIFGYQDALIIVAVTPTISNFTISDFAKV
jgi:hypothetical protein